MRKRASLPFSSTPAPRPSSLRTFDTPFGRITLLATAKGLRRVVLPGVGEALHATGGEDRQAEAHAAQAEREIREYLDGRRREFTVPLDMDDLPPFYAKVLRQLLKVPCGQTVSYGELACRAGSPKAARAVGQAMAANPIPIVIPCHRVLASGHRLGGYGGGPDLKRRLLTLEGVAVR